LSEEPPVPAGDLPARRTPYELVFGTADFEVEVFPRIRDEAAEQGVDPSDPERFAFLSVVGDALRTVLPEDSPPDAFEQYRALLFHAFNFWRFGKRHYLLDPPVARYLVEAAPTLERWDFEAPFPGLYVQLPPNLFWGSISPDSVPEPVDGLFATCSAGEDAFGQPFQRLDVLVVLGIRRDRAGFSVVPFSTAVGAGMPAAWMEARGRDEGTDFSSMLPGGEMAGLYSILTTAEALKLLARGLWFIVTNPDCVVPTDDAARRAARDAGSPPHPDHPYRRVVLNADPVVERGDE
jgi:hypothetical protein